MYHHNTAQPPPGANMGPAPAQAQTAQAEGQPQGQEQQQQGPPQGPPQGQPMRPPQAPFQLAPGQQPTPEQIQMIQQQIAAEAEKHGLTVPEYVERMKAQMMAQARMQAQQQQQQGGQPPQSEAEQRHRQGPQGAQPGQQVPIQPGPPKPEAIAMATFLQSQDLKNRTCIFNEQRKDMFKVKRAIRSIQSEAYQKARKKNPLLPEVKDRVTAENAFKLLPLSLLALRVSKVDENAGHEGHNHAKKKRVKGLWTVKVEPQQEAADEYYYVWLYQSTAAQWKNKLYAALALIGILAVVFFPVWPYTLRIGVWYLSMGMLGLLGLFFGMAIFRLILFLITFFTVKPGLWLYPNLFEDVGFFDSFRPVWAWHESEKDMKKRKKAERTAKKARREARARGELPPSSKKSKQKQVEANAQAAPAVPEPAQGVVEATQTAATGAESAPAEGLQQRHVQPRVASVEEDEEE
ncbi:hypothetical protein CKM354_000058800 [Cercospora kikuchii]|uniref:Translocation protein SEC62 n=2 Tax=Cercospora kikuchii TaxID=84275 RepID=A0A9P3C643_9PEZI|nr:uncharacterized protein CKM354_000058800 [Cercospora kikuchii]GIZ37129.1 hypothetical protein CKM354_000058800 [Cercospora kikuchii]